MTKGKLLQGVVDFHIHCEPSFMERTCDFVELCHMAEKAGYKAVAHKDHYYSSGAMAAQIKKSLFPDSPLQIFGTLAMNEPVGGLNPIALETYLTFGARVVWFPTISAKNHIDVMSKLSGFPAPAKGPKKPLTPISFTDENGKLTPEMLEAFEVLARYPNVAIASGHGNVSEVDAMVDRCVEMDIADRFFVDHPNEIINAEVDDMIRWAKKGVKIEFVAAMSIPPIVAITAPELVEHIKAIGVENVLIVSDLGQKNKGNPIEAYGEFLMQLHSNGMVEDDIRYMTSQLPSKMIGLE